ncbi:hypothetical protein [Marinibactrum halimedae]|uniref:Uncharacterized protein n=1 Tax=Marinibactrum halimedae TaxID=1444977 RepID=A0AA37T5Z2_9GAMM|nr:hypothetical protein [Marinibactrum halimedae]MCD9457609.1 hypothetical protein [Marinibactrum halimedae]GLS28028.1 hypothetical protein GCM10007877_37470 [Marinibactrum halimedae]
MNTYRIVFWGATSPEKDINDVKRLFANRFGIKNNAYLEQLFSGRVATLKRGLEETAARRLQNMIESLGVICRLEAENQLFSQQLSAAQTIIGKQDANNDPPQNALFSSTDFSTDFSIGQRSSFDRTVPGNAVTEKTQGNNPIEVGNHYPQGLAEKLRSALNEPPRVLEPNMTEVYKRPVFASQHH